MDDSSNQEAEVILVLCHSFLHDAFRLKQPVNARKFKNWLHSRFVANFIIERQSELPTGSAIAVTSKKVFDEFAVKFQGEKPSDRLKETVNILRNSIYIIDRNTINKLSLDEGVLVICDTLFSHSNYAPVLVSDIPKKRVKAEAFYRKKDPEAIIPFPIYTVAETELFLRGRFPRLCKLVDDRSEMGTRRVGWVT